MRILKRRYCKIYSLGVSLFEREGLFEDGGLFSNSKKFYQSRFSSSI